MLDPVTACVVRRVARLRWPSTLDWHGYHPGIDGAAATAPPTAPRPRQGEYFQHVHYLPSSDLHEDCRSRAGDAEPRLRTGHGRIGDLELLANALTSASAS